MTTTRSELLDFIYRFYPRGMLDIHRMHVPLYEDTEANCRLIGTCRTDHP